MDKGIYKIEIFCFVLMFALYSCKNHDKIVRLDFDTNLSTVYEKSLIRDSIVIHYYSNDSILLLKYSNGVYKQSLYFNKNDDFFEKRISVTEVGNFVGIDSILTFSKNDTVFEYKSARRFIPLIQDYSYANCIYTIKHKGSEYITIKQSTLQQSTLDTTYKEIFFYDKDYNIYKFINTWKDNECVYVKKK